LTFQFLVPNESIAMFLTRATEPLLLPLGVGAVTLFYTTFASARKRSTFRCRWLHDRPLACTS
jgi:hypothetical protein